MSPRDDEAEKEFDLEDFKDAVENLQNALERTLRLNRKVQVQACQAAKLGIPGFEEAVPYINRGFGLIWQGHGELTQASGFMPDVTVQFGGGKG